ncbi:PREDICTED: protein boule-like [Acropora digitifera]|uniref:protein boule-like n=1 Tax=Acropora digitifera TaxID=70779 RepID=UPI00077A6CA5|nr:PREDICTED: protein boule-like [Acropora digitifera]
MAYLQSESALPNESLIKIPYRIFVGGIAFNTTKDELQEFFSRYGAVRDSKIIRDPQGLSRGYGFVTFYREEDAKKVMNMGTIFFKEKRLNISEAYRRPQLLTKRPAVFASAPPLTTWASSSATNMTPVYYTSMNQGPQLQPNVQVASNLRNWSAVATRSVGVNHVTPQPETVYFLPLYYY